MATSPWHRRRAERFAQLLDEPDAPGRHRAPLGHDEALAGLAELRDQLTAIPSPRLDPEFQDGLRAMLVATAERDGLGQPEPEPAPTRRSARLARGPRVRTAVITGVTVGAVAFAGMSTASANAVPGDALYGVKRSTERAQLALASSDVGRAQLYLDFARTRLAEAGTVTDGLDRVLDDMDRDTTAGISLLTTAAASRRDPHALAPIDQFVDDQRAALDQLAERVDGADLARVGTSRDLLDEITQRTTDLRRDLELGCQPATSVDALGPRPERCFTLPAPAALDPAGQTPGPLPLDQPVPDREAAGGRQRPEAPQTDVPDSPDTGANADAENTIMRTGEPAEDADPAGDESDSGLLDGLNRLLGDLLGG